MDIEALFPRPKQSAEAAAGSVTEKIDDLIAGIQAGFGKEAAMDAVTKVAAAFPHPPEEHSPATEYLNTKLLELTTQHDTDEVLSTLKTIAQNNS